MLKTSLGKDQRFYEYFFVPGVTGPESVTLQELQQRLRQGRGYGLVQITDEHGRVVEQKRFSDDASGQDQRRRSQNN